MIFLPIIRLIVDRSEISSSRQAIPKTQAWISGAVRHKDGMGIGELKSPCLNRVDGRFIVCSGVHGVRYLTHSFARKLTSEELDCVTKGNVSLNNWILIQATCIAFASSSSRALEIH